ncbi:alveolar macrophage chemotactic factor 2-like [Hypanus sabinus]|uniref:alveolar macrophage chemotactic factor 2-like n=1 Tax=Hypanus sabinus TaxID=79690 RepID=UPI0028C45E3A|nr:alveolar macrophage chemotactic factor 2-like [Hypanus sabinus]
MNFRLQILAQIASLFLLLHTCTVEASGVPGFRCLCPVSVKAVHPKIIKDFHIIPKSPYCTKTEVILTVSSNNTEMDVCLQAGGKQSLRLQSCWERIQNDPKKKNKCIRRLSRKGRRKKGRRSRATQPTHKPM